MRYGKENGCLTFTDAVLVGVDREGMPLMPDATTRLPMPFFHNIAEMTACDVAYVVVNTMAGGDFKAEQLQHLVEEWINYDMSISAVGGSIYALEPLGGPTMSEYDLIAKLPALLLRNYFDRGLVSIDTVFFSPSRADSCAAVAKVFDDVIGQMPVMFQAAGALSETEKHQVCSVVSPDKMHVVTCNDVSLLRLCRKVMATIEHPDHRFVMISDDNAACVMARVFQFFEAYRQLSLREITDRIVICADGTNSGDVMAAEVALDLGLPARFIFSGSVSAPNELVAEIYRDCGYIVSPRSAASCKALHDAVGPDETGIFVQRSHPAKYRERLEVPLNRVILPPVALSFGAMPHVRYQRLAPSVNAIRNCLTGKTVNR